MVTTNDESIWRAMWSYKDHGKSYAAVYEREHPPGFRWLHDGFGTNWRMIEMQAAIGRIQLKKMTSWTAQRKNNAVILINALRPFSGPLGPIRLPKLACDGCVMGYGDGGASACDVGCNHAYYKFYFYVNSKNIAFQWSRDRIIEAVNNEGVPCYQGSCSEVYLEKAFNNTGWRPKQRLQNASDLGDNSIMLLVHPTLSSKELEKTASVLKMILQEASCSNI